MSIEPLVLGDSLELLIDNRGKNPPYAASGIPVVSGMSVRSDGLDLRDSKFASVDTWRQWMPSPIRRDDVIMTSEAPLGRVALVRSDDPMLVAQRVFGLRGRAGVLDSRFLYYALQSAPVQADLASRATGSTVLGIRQPELKKVRIPAPGFVQQQAVAAVLGALDDKIAANNQFAGVSARLVDTSAQALVMDSPESTLLSNVATVVKGVSYRSADLGESSTALATLKSIDREGGFIEDGYKPFNGMYRPDQELRDGDVIVAQTDITQSGDVIGRAVRVPEYSRYSKRVASLDLAIVRSKGEMPSEYLLAVLRQSAFRNHCHSYASGTTVLHLGRGAFDSYAVPMVERNAAIQYAEYARAVYQSAESKIVESRLLARTRDELLPLLMSGKLQVKDAEAVVSEAL